MIFFLTKINLGDFISPIEEEEKLNPMIVTEISYNGQRRPYVSSLSWKNRKTKENEGKTQACLLHILFAAESCLYHSL